MTSSREPDRPLDALFEPYAREIGFMLRDWNDLQEKLADLFQTVLDDKTGIGRPIWYAVPVDRFQREMLRAAAAHVFSSDSVDDKFILAEICWVLDSANALGPQRDATAHAPVALLLDEPFEFVARHLHGNPMAKKLQGKRLLAEFRLYRERARVLHDYAKFIEEYLRLGRGRWTWQKRPAWPSLPPTPAPKSRTEPRKGHARPPRPSPA